MSLRKLPELLTMTGWCLARQPIAIGVLSVCVLNVNPSHCFNQLNHELLPAKATQNSACTVTGFVGKQHKKLEIIFIKEESFQG